MDKQQTEQMSSAFEIDSDLRRLAEERREIQAEIRAALISVADVIGLQALDVLELEGIADSLDIDVLDLDGIEDSRLPAADRAIVTELRARGL